MRYVLETFNALSEGRIDPHLQKELDDYQVEINSREFGQLDDFEQMEILQGYQMAVDLARRKDKKDKKLKELDQWLTDAIEDIMDAA